MKFHFLKFILIVLVASLSFSCSSDDDSSEETSGGSTTTTNTWVKLTVTTSGGTVKPNYIVMMFDEPVTLTKPLPPIKKQVTTNADGLAYFDLNSMITSSTPKTYYFEVFVANGSDSYTLKSITHYNVKLAKGTMATSSIIVN